MRHDDLVTHRLWNCLLVLSALLAVSCDSDRAPAGPSTPAAPQTYTITGTVSDAAGRPIANATVAVADGAPNANAGKSATTNSSGTYSLPSLTFQGFSVTVTAAGYRASSRGIVLPADSTTLRSDFTLTAQAIVISGKVTGAGNAPVTGVIVAVSDPAPNPNAGRSASTDSAGNYRITDLSTATVALTATAAGYGTASRSITLSSDSETVVADFALTPTVASYVISGTVWSDAGPPVARATVLITDGSTGPNGGRGATADGNGRFRIEGLAFSPFNWVMASGAGYTPDTKRVPMTFGTEVVNTDFVLSPAAVAYGIRGTVTNQSGAPVAGAIVGVIDAAPHPNAGRVTSTDSSGSFSLTGLMQTTFKILATAGGYDATYQTIVPNAGSTTVNLALIPRSPTGPAATISFDGIPTWPGGLITENVPSTAPYSGHNEKGFSMAATTAAWFGSAYGAPGPSVQFLSAGTTSVTGHIVVTGDGRPFAATQVSIYSSVTPIPWTLIGRRSGVIVFQSSATQPNTFGNFVAINNPQPTMLIDQLEILLTNGNFTLGCPSPPCLNPMGLDNIVVSY
jgi:protocatechuate 3,4-dioxygenase beta subunit